MGPSPRPVEAPARSRCSGRLRCADIVRLSLGGTACHTVGSRRWRSVTRGRSGVLGRGEGTQYYLSKSPLVRRARSAGLEDRFAARRPQRAAGEVHAVLDEASAGAFDYAGRDRPALLERGRIAQMGCLAVEGPRGLPRVAAARGQARDLPRDRVSPGSTSKRRRRRSSKARSRCLVDWRSSRGGVTALATARWPSATARMAALSLPCGPCAADGATPGDCQAPTAP